MVRDAAVVTVEDGAAVARERRPKRGTGPHGTGPGSDLRHDQMAPGAYSRMEANGVRPIVTDLRDADEAAIECTVGRIVDHAERLH
jgi:hypothetical protein